MGSVTAIGFLAAVIALVALLARSRAKADLKDRRGTDPGHGDQLIDNGYISGGPGGGHPTTTRVTRDPQQYAKAFIPPHAQQDKKDKT